MPLRPGSSRARKLRPDIVFVSHNPEWKDDWLNLVSWFDASFKSKVGRCNLTPDEERDASACKSRHQPIAPNPV